MSSAAEVPSRAGSPDARGGSGELAVVVARLRADAGRLSELLGDAQLLSTVSEDAAARVATELTAIAEVARAGALAALARLADSGYPQQQGHVSAGSWWRAQARSSRDQAGAQVRLARRLGRDYESTAAAWAAGEITGEHAEVIATGVDNVLSRLARRLRREASAAGQELDRAGLRACLQETRRTLEGELIELGRSWGPETLRLALAHARLGADPDGASAAVMAAEAESSVRLVEVGDMAVLTAHVSQELGAKLRTVLDHYRDQVHHRGSTSGVQRRSGTARSGGQDLDPVTGQMVVRSNRQRDADALRAWVEASLDGGLGSNGQSERPHLDVTVTLAELAAGTGTAILARTGTPVPVATAARLACDGDVRLVLLDGQYRDPRTGQVVDPALAAVLMAGAGVLDYGRARRIVPPALRRLLAHRDRGCVFPGCTRPPQHTQAHHVLPWEQGGATTVANTVLLCTRHHHYVHEGGWRMNARADVPHWQPGHWRFHPPPRPPS